MFSNTHISPLKKEDSNKGSCSKLVEYLSKENEFFFNQNETNISSEKATKIIDNHSKGRLAKDESKWYSPMYAFSDEECKHVVNILFGETISNYDDLSYEQKKIYNNFFIQIARAFQDEMAKNFNKKDLGIVNGDDLIYVGVVENKRPLKGDYKLLRSNDISGKNNNIKSGFHTHIHIIQSRKANNKQQSKISPNTKYKERKTDNFNNNSRGGFNRINFYQNVELVFDKLTKYNRDYTKSFEFNNENKKIKKNKEMANNFYTQNEINLIVENSSIVNYFNSLADRGILYFEKTRGNDFVYAKKKENNDSIQSSGSIHVDDKKGWRDFSSGEGGQIIKAIMKYENLSWKDSITFLKENNGFNNYIFQNNEIQKQIKNSVIEKKSEVEIIKKDKPTSKYIFDYYNSRGISNEVISENIIQITYKRNNKIYNTGGIENIKGSFNVRGKDFKSVIGNNNDITIIKGNKIKEEVLIIEGLMDYLSYLELNNLKKPEQDIIIMNSTSNTNSLNEHIIKENYSKIDILVNKDSAGDKVIDNIIKTFEGKKIINDLRDNYQLRDNVDLNDRLILEQVKDISKKGYRL